MWRTWLPSMRALPVLGLFYWGRQRLRALGKEAGSQRDNPKLPNAQVSSVLKLLVTAELKMKKRRWGSLTSHRLTGPLMTVNTGLCSWFKANQG